MLDQFLAVAYEDRTEKTAQDALISRMRTMPTEVIEKIAFGGMPCDMKAGDPKSWLDIFKGTPLFEKAVELERAEIQLEQQDLEQRMNTQAQDTWTKRDGIRLQKKMLELDLAMEGAGSAAPAPAAAGGAPEAEEEQGIALLEQAQAQEEAAGEGNSPEEKQENDAIAELHAAHGEGAPPAKAEEGKPPAKATPPKPPAKKEPPEAEAKGKEEAEAKVASAIEAGRLLAKVANPEGHHLRRALLGNAESAAIEAKPEHAFQAKNQAEGYASQQSWKGLANGGLAGGALGAVGGALAGHRAGASVGRSGLLGSAVGALGGAMLGGVAGGIKGNHDSTASKLHGQYSQYKKEPAEKMASVPELREAAAKTAAKIAGIGGALMGAAQGAKNLVGTAYKAGGLGQVAKSVGTVGAGLIKANPLAAAGAVGGAGLLAGRLSKGNSQQA